MVEYVYDAWGKVISVTGSMASTLGAANPFRYRGYYYDTETGFYYLQSRYYDPTTGRFITADSFVSTGQGLTANNMFAYCGNNPVIRIDCSGIFWSELWSSISYVIDTTLHAVNMVALSWGIDTAAIGAFFLDMTPIDDGIYQAENDCWQQYAGYNQLYDIAFAVGTSMLSAKFEFTHNGVNYIIWIWKGDYINLGAGAEMGIYYGGDFLWYVDQGLSTNMSLTIEYCGNIIVSTSKTTWWITAFNSNYLNVNASQLTAAFTIYFSDVGLLNSFFRDNRDSGWIIEHIGCSATYVF